MATTNVYHLRRVAPAASKPCYVCYKPTSSCLITPDSRDFFYVCDGHLKDPGFASPIVSDEEKESNKKKDEMAKAIEEVKKEYEEKQKNKKKKKDKKDDDKKSEKKDDDKDEKERDDKIKAIESGNATTPKVDEPRIFALHKSILQMRVTRANNLARAKRQAELVKNPATFPSVPSGLP